MKLWIENLLKWNIPGVRFKLGEIPGNLLFPFRSPFSENHFFISVFINGKKENGKDAIAFTKELFAFRFSDKVSGPVGETIVLGEIISVVTAEAPWLVSISLIGLFLIVWLQQKSLSHRQGRSPGSAGEAAEV